MAKEGYDALIVEDIAEAAGISGRTFFRYFRAKDDLVLALPRRSHQTLADAVSGLVVAPDEPLLVALSRAAIAAGDAWDTNDDVDILWGWAAQRSDGVFHRLVAGVSLNAADMLTRAAQDAAPDRHRDEAAIAAAVVSSVVQVAFMGRLKSGGRRTQGEVLKDAFERLFTMVSASSAAALVLAAEAAPAAAAGTAKEPRSKATKGVKPNKETKGTKSAKGAKAPKGHQGVGDKRRTTTSNR